jgi:hypothetical protein
MDAQRHKTSKKELDNMRALIARDLTDAAIAGLSADRKFATAYNAALQAANMAIVCARVSDREQGWTPPCLVDGLKNWRRHPHYCRRVC